MSALEVKPRAEWGWDYCGVCGLEQVEEQGLIVLHSGRGGFYAGRMGWCDSEKCVADFKSAAPQVFTKADVEAFDLEFA